MKILKWLFFTIATLFVILCVYIAFNFTFFQRAYSYPAEHEITDANWYTPLSPVKGNFKSKIPIADSLSLPSEALEGIKKYALEHNSNAILVMHKGKLLLEEYANGSKAESVTNSMSMAKTIIGILIGIAIEEGKIRDENEFVATYIEEWKDDERAKITIKQLLTMQSGLRDNDGADNLFSDVVNMYLGDDAAQTALAVPSDKAPNTIWEYNNVNTQILAIILERTTRKSIEEYASEKLWQPLGAADANWWLDDQKGMPKAFCCFFAQAQDWLRLGQLFMQKGKWDGQQIIPLTWYAKMLTQSSLERDYGLHIWLMYEDGGLKKKDRTTPFSKPTYIIDGRGKNQVFITPALDLVIVRTGDMPADWDDSYMVNLVQKSLQDL
jgi:CubicO group peptidase (beta-lactamase class C family)